MCSIKLVGIEGKVKSALHSMLIPNLGRIDLSVNR